MPKKKMEKYKACDLELIKNNPYLLKKEYDIVLKFINKDFNKFLKKGIFSAGRRARKKLTRLRTISLYLYRAIDVLQNERRENLKKIKHELTFVQKNKSKKE
ncbi:MAG TPA: hypothetical protein PLP33_23550 [Leptospiraceae bacterium]|jgi:hypothetical protein|nr:hypothetical protein [Leptospiraceae bacterium]